MTSRGPKALAGLRLRQTLGVLRYVPYRIRSGSSDRPFVFVMGAPRSGTTLLQSILARHRGFFSIDGETGFFSPYFVRSRARDWPEEQARLLEGCHATNLVDLFAEFAEAARARAGAPPDAVFVEKTPQHVVQLGFVLSHFPEARVVNLYRDGRDCYASAKGRAELPQNTATRFARYWRRCVRARLAVGTHPRVLDIRYETLAGAPAATLDAVMDFLGAAAEPGQLDPAGRAGDARAGQEIFRRLAEPVTAASVGRWRSRLSPAEVGAFEAAAGAELRALGYAAGAS